mgnify:CR=1 FL=1
MSALKETLNRATKEAMKARDKDRVATLRMVNAELKRIEVDERRDLSDEDVFAVLNKMLKQRKDAMAQFQDAKREDLAAVEAYEIGVIEYAPNILNINKTNKIKIKFLKNSKSCKINIFRQNKITNVIAI